MSHKDFEITSNNVTIRGTFYFSKSFDEKSKNPLIILLTGDGSFGRKGASWLPLVDTMRSIDYSACIFDFHGLGTSDGELKDLTFTKAVQNLEDVLEYIKTTNFFDMSRIGVLGSSFGGGIALIVQSKSNPFSMVALRSPVSFPVEAYETEHTLEEMQEWKSTKISPVLGWHWDSYIDALKYNIYDMAKSINSNVFIVHGNKDRIVPLAQSIRLSYILKDLSQIKILDGVEHNYKQNNAFDTLFDLMKTYFAGRL